MYIYIFCTCALEEGVRLRRAEQPIGRGQFLCFAISGVLLEDVAPSG